jgi:hypothetical protein
MDGKEVFSVAESRQVIFAMFFGFARMSFYLFIPLVNCHAFDLSYPDNYDRPHTFRTKPNRRSPSW